MRKLLLSLAISLGIFIAPLASQAEEIASPTIKASEIWAKASLSGASMSAAYLTITNRGDKDDALIGVKTDIADAELHSMEMHGDVMRMRHIERIAVPAGESVTLEPGGNHIMLMGLKSPLIAGKDFIMTLTFEHAGAQQVAVSIK